MPNQTIPKKTCPFCGGVLTPVFYGNGIHEGDIKHWECDGEENDCQFNEDSDSSFGMHGITDENLKLILKWKAAYDNQTA